MENLIEKFKKTIPEEEQEELANALKERIDMLTKTFQKEAMVFGIDDTDYVKEQTEKEIIKLINADLSEKKRELLTDNKLERIREISRNAFNVAQEILLDSDKKAEFDVESDIHELQTLINEVEEYNKDLAKKLVSEGILDLKFIADPNVDFVSIRLGMIIHGNEEVKKLIIKRRENFNEK